MDITPFLDLRIAPRAVFDALDERKTRVRFMVPDPAKGPAEWRAVTRTKRALRGNTKETRA